MFSYSLLLKHLEKHILAIKLPVPVSNYETWEKINRRVLRRISGLKRAKVYGE
jgi:hypothetical protein